MKTKKYGNWVIIQKLATIDQNVRCMVLNVHLPLDSTISHVSQIEITKDEYDRLEEVVLFVAKEPKPCPDCKDKDNLCSLHKMFYQTEFATVEEHSRDNKGNKGV